MPVDDSSVMPLLTLADKIAFLHAISPMEEYVFLQHLWQNRQGLLLLAEAMEWKQSSVVACVRK
jgi:hypothetical protein